MKIKNHSMKLISFGNDNDNLYSDKCLKIFNKRNLNQKTEITISIPLNAFTFLPVICKKNWMSSNNKIPLLIKAIR